MRLAPTGTWLASALVVAALQLPLPCLGAEDETSRVRELEARNRLLERQHRHDVERIESLEAEIERLRAKLAKADSPDESVEEPIKEQELIKAEPILTREALVNAVRRAYTFMSDTTPREKETQLERFRTTIEGKQVALSAIVHKIAPDGQVTLCYESSEKVRKRTGTGTPGGRRTWYTYIVPLEKIRIRARMDKGQVSNLVIGKPAKVAGTITEVAVVRGGGGSHEKPVVLRLALNSADIRASD